jgi:uncharacterized protein (DUF433 family)
VTVEDLMAERPVLSDIISVNRDVMSGMPVFRGTRVPIEVVILDLAGGESIDEILENYPTLDRADVMALLNGLSEAASRPKAA